MSVYLIVQRVHTATCTPLEFLTPRLHGCPRVDVVLVGSQAIGLIEFPGDRGEWVRLSVRDCAQHGWGHQLWATPDLALAEFGRLVRAAAPGTVLGLEPAGAA